MASVSVIAVGKKKKNCPTLRRKIEVINYVKKNPSTTLKNLAEIFQCGKTQIAQILKSKGSLLSRVHTAMKFCSRKFIDVNKALYDWYLLACSKKYISRRPTVDREEIAEQLSITNFSGSRGWEAVVQHKTNESVW